MKRTAFLVLSALAMLVATACDEGAKKDEPAANTTKAAPAIAEDDLAVPADFEDEAARTISVANYKAELDTLETELN